MFWHLATVHENTKTELAFWSWPILLGMIHENSGEALCLLRHKLYPESLTKYVKASNWRKKKPWIIIFFPPPYYWENIYLLTLVFLVKCINSFFISLIMYLRWKMNYFKIKPKQIERYCNIIVQIWTTVSNIEWDLF